MPPGGQEPLVAIENISKRYGRITAVAGVTLTLRAGEICGFVGANGGGKTTTLRMLAGILRADGGRGHVLGFDLQHDAAKIRAFFVHPKWVRRGIGSMILEACEKAARAAGFTRCEMGATLTGVPLYRARGYVALEKLEAPLANGESLTVVRMEKRMSSLK